MNFNVAVIPGDGIGPEKMCIRDRKKRLPTNGAYIYMDVSNLWHGINN